MKRSTWLWGALGIAVLAGAGFALRAPPVTVEAVTVKRGAFEQTVSDDGRTRVRDRYVVSAPLAGRVERIALRVGDRVGRGQPVARLTPAAPAFLDARSTQELRERVGAAQAQQQRAAAEVRRLEAQRDQAKSDAARQARLAGEGFVSPTAREQTELALRVAERALESARFAEDAAGHDLAQARAALTRYQAGGAEGAAWAVTSPVSGAVLKVSQESEAVVGIGAPLVELGDPRVLEAVVDVLSQEALALRPGMPARIAPAPATSLPARVRRVEPAAFTKVSALGVEEQRVNVILDFDDPPEALPVLGDGYRIDAHILTLRVDNAVLVPVGALFREGDGWALFAIERGRAVRRAVNVAARNNTMAWVDQGLAEGERVVVYPSDALRDGSRVREIGRGKG